MYRVEYIIVFGLLLFLRPTLQVYNGSLDKNDLNL